MNSREKAEEFLNLMFEKNKKCLVEKTKDLSQGEKGCLFYLTFVENEGINYVFQLNFWKQKNQGKV